MPASRGWLARRAGARYRRLRSPPTGRSRVSELQLHRQLYLALGRTARRARRAREHRRDRAERRAAKLPVRIRKLRMIEDVEHLDARLAIDRPDFSVLDHREIDVELPRPTDAVSAGVAEGSGRVASLLETRRIEPRSDRWVRQCRIADRVGTIVRDAGRQ